MKKVTIFLSIKSNFYVKYKNDKKSIKKSA